jgi:hypothetical protein
VSEISSPWVLADGGAIFPRRNHAFSALFALLQ